MIKDTHTKFFQSVAMSDGTSKLVGRFSVGTKKKYKAKQSEHVYKIGDDMSGRPIFSVSTHKRVSVM